MNLNPWHDIEVGEKSPEIVNAIIEIPRDSTIKYEVDKKTGLLMLDRFLYSAVHYPGDYGFVPKTLWDDGDPIDILILTQRAVYPMTLVKARVIGIIRMVDGNERDDKLIAVYDGDPRYKEIQDVKDLPKHIIEEIKHFFKTYKELQGKKCNINQILGKDYAYKDIEKSKEMYKKYIAKNKFNKD